MKQLKFRGLMAPVFTAFNNDSLQSLNLNVISEYSKFLAGRGIDGVLVNGTSGEGMTMSVEERKKSAEEWAKSCKANKQCLMVQVGGAPFPDVLELAKHANSIDVDAILCLPDLFNKPKSAEELVEYLRLVGNAAPNTPLLYYHLPAWTNVTVNMAEFLNKAYNQVPTLQGIKFTSTNLDEGTACLKAGNNSFAVFLGADQIMAGAYALGFDSAIATTLNIFPDDGKSILVEMKNHNIPSARKIQSDLTQKIDLILKHGAWVPAMKAAMNVLTPINVGPPRLPLKSVSSESINELKKDFNV